MTRRCPICKKEVPKDLPEHPFCSSRCRQVDLGRWLNEDYRISRPITPNELEEGFRLDRVESDDPPV